MGGHLVPGRQMETANSAAGQHSRVRLGDFFTTRQGPADEPWWIEFGWVR
jgi:hypothetical protein